MTQYTKKEIRISLTRHISKDYLNKVNEEIGTKINYFRQKLQHNFNLNEATIIKSYIPRLGEYIDNYPFVPIKEIQEMVLEDEYGVGKDSSPVVCTLLKNERECIQKFNKEMNKDLYQLVNIHLLSKALAKRKKNQIIA